MKPFLGDALSLGQSAPVLKVLVKNAEREIFFSGVVTKLNRRNKMQERVLVVTEGALYNVDKSAAAGEYKIKHRIPLSGLGSISLSPFEDNFIIIHVPNEYDYLLLTERKTELVTTLLHLHQRATSQLLSVTFAEKLEFRGKEEGTREATFRRLEGGVDMAVNNARGSKGTKNTVFDSLLNLKAST